MELHGDIRLMPLTDVFQWLELRMKTGVLKIENGIAEHRFYLKDGMIVTATSPRYHTTDSEENVRYLLGDSLRLITGRYGFIEGPLPEEIAAVELRLEGPKLIAEIFQQPDPQSEKALMTAVAGGGSPRFCEPFRPAEELRLAIIDRLILNDFKVPLLPTIVRKVLEITRRDNYSISKLGSVIMADQVLAAQLLKYANSPLHAGEREVDSIGAAIQRLGAAAVINLTIAISLQSARTGRDIFLKQRQQIWQQSLACALMARVIAQTLKVDRETAFLCGLLMDFGKIVLLSLIHDVMRSDARLQRAPVGFVGEVLESYHCKVGGIVAEKWALPTPVREAITFHHTPSLTPDYSTWAAIASLSDSLAAHCSESEDAQDQAEVEKLVVIPSAEMLGLSVAQMKVILEYRPECLRFSRDFLVR